MRAIVIELMDHTSNEEAVEFAAEINSVFQPHYEAVVRHNVVVVATPEDAPQTRHTKIS